MAAAPPDTPSWEGGESTPEVAVIVINWQREATTVECVRRVLDWRRLRPHVIVVDNGSSAETLTRLESALGRTTLIAAESNRGFGGANNLALAAVESDFVLLLNNDATIEEAAVTKLSDCMKSRPEVGIAGPLLEDSLQPHRILAAGGRDILRFARTHLTAEERAREIESAVPFTVDYVPGTAALVRTHLLRQLDGFDEAYFFSGEMADLAVRAKRHGFVSAIVPSARARHDVAVASDLRSSLYAYYSLRNRFLHARRHARPPIWSLARWTARGALSCLAALARGEGRSARCLASAIAHGLSGRFGEAGARRAA